MPNQDKLQTAVTAFEQWRKARTHGAARIPESLRQQSVKLLSHYRVSQIIRALKLSHSQLKRWDHVGLKKVPAQTQFIKLPEEKNVSIKVNEGLKTAALTIEWHFPQGAQLRLSGELCATTLCSLVQTLCHAGTVPNGGAV